MWLEQPTAFQSEYRQCDQRKQECPADQKTALVTFPAFLDHQVGEATGFLEDGGMAVALGHVGSLRRLPGSVRIENRLHTLVLDVDAWAYALRKRLHGRAHEGIEIRLMHLVVAEEGDLAPVETRFRLIGESYER